MLTTRCTWAEGALLSASGGLELWLVEPWVCVEALLGGGVWHRMAEGSGPTVLTIQGQGEAA